MSSFRNHRVVIASVFLPTIAVVEESTPPTPEQPFGDNLDTTISAVANRLVTANVPADLPAKPKPLKSSIITTKNHHRQPSASNPLLSIVEDLKDKVRHSCPKLCHSPLIIHHQSRHATPSLSPANETCSNPFTKLTRFATTPEIVAVKKHQTTHQDTQSTARLRRKQYRSSSRRATSLTGQPNVTLSQSSAGADPKVWHMELNPRGNGGLKNAVDSVEDRIRKKLWVGTLGTCTDEFGEDLRKDINSRMLAQRSSIPVWIPDAEFESFYDEFCHQVSWFSLSRVSVGSSTELDQVLWPCLHYAVPDAPKTKMFYESASYKQYVAVNQRFADIIIANHQEGDMSMSIILLYLLTI